MSLSIKKFGIQPLSHEKKEASLPSSKPNNLNFGFNSMGRKVIPVHHRVILESGIDTSLGSPRPEGSRNQ